MSSRRITVREAFFEASSLLQAAGMGAEESRFVAETLLRHFLGWNRTSFFMRWGEYFPQAEWKAWQEMLDRKIKGEPLQYILGEQEFYGLPFSVSPAVLIPRPETELLVEAIIKEGCLMWPEEETCPTVIDIGTGSGAISIALAVNCPEWVVYACDISMAALDTARSNARRNLVEDRITFMHGDLLEPAIALGIQADILISNPPYIESAVIANLAVEVRDHEPRTALDGGEDGLYFYRKILGQLQSLPSAPALIGFEVGMGQAKAVAGLMRNCGFWEEFMILPDLAGIDRHVIGYHRKK